jgi:hypothetical protein
MMVGEREKRNLGADNVIIAQLRNQKKRRISEIPQISKVISLEEAADVSKGPTTSVDTAKDTSKDISVDTSKEITPSAAVEDATADSKGPTTSLTLEEAAEVSKEPTTSVDTDTSKKVKGPTTSVDTPKDISVDISKETSPSAAVAEEPTPSADTLKASCLEAMEADGTLVRPTTLPDRFKSQILNLARQNRYENPTLATGAVPSDGQFPDAFLELPGQVEYMNQDAEGTRGFFCNFRFCEKPNSRQLQHKDITSSSTDTTYGTVSPVNCSGCHNLLHRDCCLYDESNPHDRVCGW